MASKSSSGPRNRKIYFSVSLEQYQAARAEAARLRIPMAELFYRREQSFLESLADDHDRKLSRLEAS